MKAGGKVELSKRECEVVDGLVIGKTNSEIAEELDISSKTVDTHRGNALKKLKLRNNAELVVYALREGLVSVDGLYTQAQLDDRIDAEIQAERASVSESA